MTETEDGAIAHALLEVARRLHGQRGIDDTLQVVVDAAVEMVDGAQEAGVMLVGPKSQLTVPAQTGDVVRKIDELQITEHQGPCLDAIRANESVVIEDLADDPRWPRFGAAAAELGVRSMISFQLIADDRELGSLSLLATQPHAFDERAVVLGKLFASHAAIALHCSTTEAGLETALAGRDVIGQAKGILMQRDGVDADRAFKMLVEASQQSNMKLLAVAEWLVSTTVGTSAPS
jgi:GAF domain-containing protein